MSWAQLLALFQWGLLVPNPCPGSSVPPTHPCRANPVQHTDSSPACTPLLPGLGSVAVLAKNVKLLNAALLAQVLVLANVFLTTVCFILGRTMTRNSEISPSYKQQLQQLAGCSAFVPPWQWIFTFKANIKFLICIL